MHAFLKDNLRVEIPDNIAAEHMAWHNRYCLSLVQFNEELPKSPAYQYIKQLLGGDTEIYMICT